MSTQQACLLRRVHCWEYCRAEEDLRLQLRLWLQRLLLLGCMHFLHLVLLRLRLLLLLRQRPGLQLGLRLRLQLLRPLLRLRRLLWGYANAAEQHISANAPRISSARTRWWATLSRRSVRRRGRHW